MDKYISDLLELIKAHPELPIVPMVDSEIVCDDGYARWKGAWGARTAQGISSRKSTLRCRG